MHRFMWSLGWRTLGLRKPHAMLWSLLLGRKICIILFEKSLGWELLVSQALQPSTKEERRNESGGHTKSVTLQEVLSAVCVSITACVAVTIALLAGKSDLTVHIYGLHCITSIRTCQLQLLWQPSWAQKYPVWYLNVQP